MAHERLSEILSTISDLNENNIIERVKEKLEKEDPGTYEEWQDNGFDINYTFDDQNTFLHIAARDNLVKMAELLIKKGANVNTADQEGCTPLHCAALNGHKEIVELLLDKGANINVVGQGGSTVLHHAVSAKNCQVEIVKTLIEKGGDVNVADEGGYTPLHCAAFNGHKEIVEFLLEKGANVNAVGQDRSTVLHHAVSAENCQVEIVKTLIEKGVNVDVADRYGRTPLCWATRNGHLKVVKILFEKGADPLLKHKSFGTLKLFIKLIKNGFEHPKKAEEIQQQEDDEYELVKYSLLLRNDCSLTDVVERSAFGKLISTWLADMSNLTESQKELNKKFLSIFKDFPHVTYKDYKNDVEKIKKFLLDHKSNQDLKTILNLKRGESKLTILHVLSTMECGNAEEFMNLLLEAETDPNEKDATGRTPLHYAARPGSCSKIVGLLREKGANRDIQDNKGKTPMEIAINNPNYYTKKYLLTDKEKSLLKKSRSAFGNPTKQQELLSEYKNTQDFERICHFFGWEEGPQIGAKDVLYGIFRKKTQVDHNGKKRSCKSINLWDKSSIDKQNLHEYFGELDEVQDINQLEQVVTEAIEFGVRLNFSCDGNIYMNTYESRYNFTDYVIKKISELKIFQVERDIEVASRIVCHLVSKGAVLETLSSIIVIDKLEKFEGHKANLKEARKRYVRYSLRFLEAAKSATTGTVKEAKMDNFTFYLKCSKNSTVKVAKVINGIGESTELRRDVIAIGESEIEILTKNGVRNYTNLKGNIVLTLHTDLGKVDVRLYPDVQDKNKIIVEVSNKEETLEKFKNYKEELGENCLLGDYSVYDAIEQGYFEYEELKSSEVISLHEEVLEKDSKYSVSSSLGNISLSPIVQQGIEKVRSQG
ncbi:ankyrin repeat domain protein [Wolbachia endosymbiont of Armadillidium vulgare str. wVulC]|uniref:ankyrin repeat domain-containing protein n=1 Tax=Wolbachia endosymbiont of Armadillidium vulgare TaxID=77039 RepID=UPI00064A3209|nr:ankyrin repeat domain-containing protein [Wolbachia endosymbiont of Armadillidium vulgare]KLT22437.1 ankyrin repeat domain protein [Wolbachia endosymbiont of Armadillidium vulgare str. wVulC]OJH32821.1 Phosphocholine transferase AnkX [Wolbachia endosymbiont of Armadillidium vulgare]